MRTELLAPSALTGWGGNQRPAYSPGPPARVAPATQGSTPNTPDAAAELEQLIADQARDQADGHRVRTDTFSLDAFRPDADLSRRRQVASDPRHGTLTCYVRLRCRCAKCRAASARYARERRAARRAA